jgi:hypothetical protein
MNGYVASRKTQIFLQKACLITINRVAKKKLIQDFRRRHPEIFQKLNRAYEDMLDSFSASQEILSNLSFRVLYDEITFEVQDKNAGNKMGERAKLRYISYFSDFIFIQ